MASLYQVFIFFSLLTTMLYLHIESELEARRFGLFAMLMVSIAVGLLFKYGHIFRGITTTLFALNLS